jgi:hypothetical protein
MGHDAVWEPGHLDALRCVAVVGSRNPTPQGAENAREFGQALAQGLLGADQRQHQRLHPHHPLHLRSMWFKKVKAQVKSFKSG